MLNILKIFKKTHPSKTINEIREIEGDGKAIFISEGSIEDFDEFEKEQKGILGWYKKIKNL